MSVEFASGCAGPSEHLFVRVVLFSLRPHAVRLGVLRLGAPQLPRACRLAWAIFLIGQCACSGRIEP